MSVPTDQVNTVTWKPHVTQVGSLPTPNPNLDEPTLVTSTSLKHDQPSSKPIGSGFNSCAKPFGNYALVNKQYNSPINLFSNKNIAETIKAHSEILAPGVVGINFMKQDAPVNKESDVYKAILEEEASKNQKRSGPQFGNQYGSQQQQQPAQNQTQTVDSCQAAKTNLNYSREELRTSPTLQSHSFRRLQHILGDEDPAITRHVEAPVSKSCPPCPPNQTLENNVCFECGRLIVGVFCKIKDRKLHEECFKCSTCGSSLKNQGYFNINEKLYCEIHAQQAAQANCSPNRIVQPNCTTIRPKELSKPNSPAFQTSKSYLSSQISENNLKTNSPSLNTNWNVPDPVKTTPNLTSNSITNSNISSISTSTNFKSYNPSLYQSVPHPYPGPGIDSYKSTISTPKFTWPNKCTVQKSETIKTSYSTGQGNTIKNSVSNFSTNTYSNERIENLSSNFDTCLKLNENVNYKVSPSTLPKPNLNNNWQNQNQTLNNLTSTSSNSQFSRTQQQTNLSIPGQSSFTGSRPAPRRGRGQLKNQDQGDRIPICANLICGQHIRGPFISALGKTWCPEHFACANLSCKRSLQDCGFVEEKGTLYCESCFELHFAPTCNKCKQRIKGDCLVALDKQYHPECFVCSYCKKLFANTSFYLEDGLPYCEKDWNELFTTKCISCGYAIEAGDRWVEALNNNYHSQCFKCTVCGRNLEGQSFYAKGGKPFCKAH